MAAADRAGARADRDVPAPAEAPGAGAQWREAAPRQRELFPEAFDVEADALAALETLEIERGVACLRGARAADPTLANLDALELALAWLAGALGGRRDAEAVARAFRARPAADLPQGAAAFVDRALARRGLELASGAFLDAGGRVARGSLLLVLDRLNAARRALDALADEHPDRGDVVGAAADAAHLAGEPERASALCVRALVADPAGVDLPRSRIPALAALARELGATAPQASDASVADGSARDAGPLARARLFPEAWIRGLVRVPPADPGLDALRSSLAARFPPRASDPAARMRRFALLLYADRADPDVDLGTREELAELEPDLFARVMARLRAGEGA